ncbi:MAG: hypothetical protein ACFCUX_01940 [Candidatus Methylacidiphilales bacterium]
METAVVVLIVGLLVSLSIPVVQMVIDRSKEAACLSNLRQIGLAVQSYAAEHDNNLPQLAAGRSSRSEDIPVMDTVLLPYVNDSRIFRCPADTRDLFEISGSSYFWNYFPTLQEDGSVNLKIPSLEFSLLQVSEPSKIPLVVDKEAFHRAKTHASILYADGSARRE